MVMILHALLLALAVGGAPAQLAQPSDPPPALRVTIRDTPGAGLANIAVTVRDQSGRTDLARLITDAGGQAQVSSLPTSAVRVVVAGQLADGTPLAQHGQDARGVLVMLEDIPTEVVLRVAPDGAVIPDPEAMVTSDLGVPIEPIQRPPTSIAPVATPEPVLAAPIAGHEPARPAPDDSRLWLIALTLVGITIICGLGLILFVRSIAR